MLEVVARDRVVGHLGIVHAGRIEKREHIDLGRREPAEFKTRVTTQAALDRIREFESEHAAFATGDIAELACGERPAILSERDHADERHAIAQLDRHADRGGRLDQHIVIAQLHDMQSPDQVAGIA